jgi:hypothetical protein
MIQLRPDLVADSRLDLQRARLATLKHPNPRLKVGHLSPELVDDSRKIIGSVALRRAGSNERSASACGLQHALMLERLDRRVDGQLGHGVLRGETAKGRDLVAHRVLTASDAPNDLLSDLGTQRDRAVLIDRHGDRLPTT